MDDAFFIAGYNKNDSESHALAKESMETMRTAYNENMTLEEQGKVNDQTLQYLEAEIKINDVTFQVTPFMKNKESLKLGKLKINRLASGKSYTSNCIKKATIISLTHRLWKCSNDLEIFFHAIRNFIHELMITKYTPRTIVSALMKFKQSKLVFVHNLNFQKMITKIIQEVQCAYI